MIKRIVDRTGNVFEENQPKIEQVIDPRIAFMSAYVMQDVVESGPGREVKSIGQAVRFVSEREPIFLQLDPDCRVPRMTDDRLTWEKWPGSDDIPVIPRIETDDRVVAVQAVFHYERCHRRFGI